jgi:hypothetical protein
VSSIAFQKPSRAGDRQGRSLILKAARRNSESLRPVGADCDYRAAPNMGFCIDDWLGDAMMYWPQSAWPSGPARPPGAASACPRAHPLRRCPAPRPRNSPQASARRPSTGHTPRPARPLLNVMSSIVNRSFAISRCRRHAQPIRGIRSARQHVASLAIDARATTHWTGHGIGAVDGSPLELLSDVRFGARVYETLPGPTSGQAPASRWALGQSPRHSRRRLAEGAQRSHDES